MQISYLLTTIGRAIDASSNVTSLDDIDRAIDFFAPVFTFTRSQMAVLAVTWSIIHSKDSEDEGSYSRLILMTTFGEEFAVRNISTLTSLVDMGVLLNSMEETNWLMHHRLQFSTDFEEAIETAERTNHMPPIGVFASEQELIDVYISLGRRLDTDKHYPRAFRQQFMQARQLVGREERSPEFPLSAFMREREASTAERLAVGYLAYAETINRMLTVDELHNVMRAHDQSSYKTDTTRISQKLVDKGLAEYLADQNFRLKTAPISLSAELRKLMQLDAMTDVVGIGQHIGVVTPKQGLHDLIVDDEVQRLLRTSVDRFRLRAHALLQAWGVATAGYSENTDERLILLFYGPPGTGKTMAAYALAKELERTVITIDASSVLASYVGESERQLRALFARLAQLRMRSSTPPVVVINEADALLHQRTQAAHAADHMQNNLVSILLEEIERFQGLLVLTVNDVRRMDDAFSRRIDMKIFFDRPSAPLRERLWALYLPSTIPGAESIDLPSLAQQYDLSGGQIRTIIANTCAEAVLRPEGERRISDEDLRRFIILECRGQFETSQRLPFGFIN